MASTGAVLTYGDLAERLSRLEELKAENADLKAQLAAAKPDAKRLAWLLSCEHTWHFTADSAHLMDGPLYLDPYDSRTSIDMAMERAEETTK